jgi:hypothetical protein
MLGIIEWPNVYDYILVLAYIEGAIIGLNDFILQLAKNIVV